MFDELFPEASDTALTARLNRPPTPQAPRFSTWGLFAAAPKGVAAGASEAIGSTADMLGAYGSVMGTTGVSAGGMFSLPTPEERKQQIEATDKLLSDGPDYMSEGGRSFRNVAKDYTPDPITTHMAEGAVFNLFRMGSKAITAATTMGNIPGAVVAGAEEGFTMADQLAQQGVDIGTRAQVGAVNAVVNAAGFALPAAGKTWMQTGALALVGGPVSFVTQQAATREILQAADYTKQAEQYDPFDPLGLALSTILPLGFGALAMRGSKGAKPAIHPPEDIVDAARVSLVRQHMDSTNPAPGDLAAADAHVKAYTQAMEQLAAGERVSVVDVAPRSDQYEPNGAVELDKPVSIGTGREQRTVTYTLRDDGRLIRTIKYPGEDPTVDFQVNDKSGEDIGWVSSEGYGKGDYYPGQFTPDAAIKHAKADAEGMGYTVNNISPITEWSAGLNKALGEMLDVPVKPVDAATAPDASIPARDGQQAAAVETAALKDAAPGEANTRLYNLVAVNEKTGEKTTLTKRPSSHKEAVTMKDKFDSKVGRRIELEEVSAPDLQVDEQVVKVTRTDAAASPTETRLNDIAVRNPQALDAEIATAFDDAGRPTERMTVREYLDQVRREALADMQDAGLLEVAANCFLNGGL